MILKVPEPVLRLLRRIEASDEKAIVCGTPGGWWIDCDRVSGKAPWAAIRLMLINEQDYSDEETHYYALTEIGRGALVNGEAVIADDDLGERISALTGAEIVSKTGASGSAAGGKRNKGRRR